jgi:hypothetical protein
MARPKRRPGNVDVNGEVYSLIVLLIHTKNPDGSPALMTHVPDARSIDLAGGEEFMTAYAPRSMVKPRGPR